MSDKNRGLYEKFHVIRTDGRSNPGQKHAGCRYFVLDLDHDPFAIEAIAAYAEACQETLPALAKDLDAWLETKMAANPGWVKGEIERLATHFKQCECKAELEKLIEKRMPRPAGGGMTIEARISKAFDTAKLGRLSLREMMTTEMQQAVAEAVATPIRTIQDERAAHAKELQEAVAAERERHKQHIEAFEEQRAAIRENADNELTAAEQRHAAELALAREDAKREALGLCHEWISKQEYDRKLSERAAKPQETALPTFEDDESRCQWCSHYECNHENGRCLIANCRCEIGGVAIGTFERNCAWWLI